MPVQILLVTAVLLLAVLVFLLVLLLRARALLKEHRTLTISEPSDTEAAVHCAETLSELIRYRAEDALAHSEEAFIHMREYLLERCPALAKASAIHRPDNRTLLLRWHGTDEKQPALLFSCHLDTPPAGGNWEYPPYNGEIAENAVWGRGALEGKGVCCAIFEAAERLCASGFVPKTDLCFAVISDKESPSSGAGPITRLFRFEGLRFSAVFDEGDPIYRDLFKSTDRAQAFIGIAEKGRMTLHLSAFDREGRASVPPTGGSAIGRLSEAICRAEAAVGKIPLYGVSNVFIKKFAPYLSSGERIAVANPAVFRHTYRHIFARDPILGAAARTTFVPTVVTGGIFSHSLPPMADAVVDVRVSVEERSEDIEKLLQYLFEGLGVRIEISDVLEPSAVSSAESAVYECLEKTLCAVFADPVIAPSVFSGSTPSRFYELFTDNIYRITPFVLTTAEAEMMHGKNERISIAALGKAVTFYRTLIESVAGERIM